MADSSLENQSSPERSPSAPKQRESLDSSKVIDNQGREAIAETLADGSESASEGVDIAETVSESKEAGKEQKSDGRGKKSSTQNAQDDRQSGSSGGFVFDENKLPKAPQMIKKIEEELRGQIKVLQRDAKKYSGGFFSGKADLNKYSEATIQLREKNIMLKKIVSMAYDAVKKIYIQMFKPKSP
ncbi:MAG: hypothetical protein P1V18_01040 [Candidatus Gracilibacteria bacterium]|nr:hypothetical protein [Candidatus Gracilibacteria bacterium]